MNRPTLPGIIGSAGLLLAIGAAGGIECGNATWSQGLALIAVGLATMGACLFVSWRTR